MRHLFNDRSLKFINGKLVTYYWFYDPAIGWVWITEDVYPIIYSPVHGWLSFTESDESGRWYYSYSLGVDINFPQD
jgi:hypothetical protein